MISMRFSGQNLFWIVSFLLSRKAWQKPWKNTQTPVQFLFAVMGCMFGGIRGRKLKLCEYNDLIIKIAIRMPIIGATSGGSGGFLAQSILEISGSQVSPLRTFSLKI